MIRVRSLGGCEIQIGRKRITLTTEVPFALAFYLAQRAGEQLTRDELAETFWGSRDPAKARHSLRQTLYKLRQKGFPLDEGAEEVLLDAALVESDVARVLSAEWPSGATAEEVEAAGEFLPGLTRRMAPGIMEWLDALRSQVAGAHRRGALAQIVRARREARWADLERWAHQVLQSDPLNEEATFARAESAAMAGSKAAALEILDAYMAELGDHAPKISLPASVLRRRIAERQPEWVQRGPREVALIGRAELMGRLTGFVEEAARGHGGGVLLWGAPGVGKTRLASEMRVFAELRGFRSVLARSDRSHSARPLASLLALLPGILDLPGVHGAAPTHLGVVQRMARSGDAEGALTPSGAGADAYDRLLTALSDVFRSVAEDNRTLVVLDDAHNADDSSLRAIAQLATATADTKMMWLITSRSRDSRWRDLPFTEHLRRVTVAPLDPAAAEELALLVSEQLPANARISDLGRVARLSGGNPLFVRVLAAGDDGLQRGLPRTLQEIVSERLSATGEEERRILRVIATLGNLATVPRVSRVLGLPFRDLLPSVERLEGDGVVTLGASQTLEIHECWQTAVSDSISAATSAVLAYDCASQLEAESGDDDALDRLWRSADLYVQAGDNQRARDLFTQCADRLMRMGLSQDAAPVLHRALALATEPLHRLEIRMHLGRAYHLAGELERTVQVARDAWAESPAPSRRAAVAQTILQSLLVDALTKLRMDHRRELQLLAEMATSEEVPTDARLFACLFGIRVVFNDTRSALEDTFHDTARRINLEAGPSLLGRLVELVWTTERGQESELRSTVASFSTLLHVGEPVKLRAMTHRYLAAALRWLGDFDEAVHHAQRAHDVAEQAGLQDEVGSVLELLSFMFLDIEDLDGARAWIDRWSVIDSRVTYPSRRQALLQARSRLLIQEGRFDEALSLYRERLTDIRTDQLTKRRVATLATVMLANASLNRRSEADEDLPSVLAALSTERATAFFDYPAEAAIRTLTLTGRSDVAERVATAYCAARLQRLPRGLPPFCRNLRRLAGVPVS